MTKADKLYIRHFMTLKGIRRALEKGYTSEYQIVKSFLNLKKNGMIK